MLLTKRQSFWLIIGPTVMMFAYALTSPVVHIYFMKLVDPQVLAVANMLSVGLAAIVNATVTKDKFLSWYRKHFFWIVSLDIISYVVICYTGTEYDATIRFIGLAITGAVSTTLWAVVMRSAVNDVLDKSQRDTSFYFGDLIGMTDTMRFMATKQEADEVIQKCIELINTQR